MVGGSPQRLVKTTRAPWGPETTSGAIKPPDDIDTCKQDDEDAATFVVVDGSGGSSSNIAVATKAIPASKLLPLHISAKQHHWVPSSASAADVTRQTISGITHHGEALHDHSRLTTKRQKPTRNTSSTSRSASNQEALLTTSGNTIRGISPSSTPWTSGKSLTNMNEMSHVLTSETRSQTNVVSNNSILGANKNNHNSKTNTVSEDPVIRAIDRELAKLRAEIDVSRQRVEMLEQNQHHVGGHAGSFLTSAQLHPTPKNQTIFLPSSGDGRGCNLDKLPPPSLLLLSPTLALHSNWTSPFPVIGHSSRKG